MAYIRSDYQKPKRRVIIAAFVFTGLTAPLLVLFTGRSMEDQLLTLISVAVYSVLLLVWCYYDSLERNKRLSGRWRVLIVLVGWLALPIYLIKSRGLRRGSYGIGVALLLSVGLFLIAFLIAEATAFMFEVE
jgi:hypothetical protein